MTLLHGEADPIVDVMQSRVYLGSRREAGFETELFTYPRTPHAFFAHADDPVALEGVEVVLRSFGRSTRVASTY